MFFSWIQEGNWKECEDIWTIKPDYGFFHVYAFTMTMGVVTTILLSIFKLYRRGIPLIELFIGASLIVPIGLLGGSFFGKLNAEGIGQNAGGLEFFGLFAFWKGGMSIHGAIYSGTTLGVFIFYFLSKKTKISVWLYADCIIPNVLIGQAFGRWGNFFNHELFGKPVGQWINGKTEALKLLPNFIKQNMVWQYVGEGETINNIVLVKNNLYVMSPIFLYESIFLILSWILITFVISNIGIWFGKKPWKLHPNKYGPKISKFKIWKNEVIENYNYKDIELYKKEIININESKKIKQLWKKGKLLERCNNPEKYLLIRSGVEAGLYFFFWNLIRLVLEINRPDDHLFLMYNRGWSITIIALSMILGLIVSLLAQFVFPYLFRNTGYIYEQEYFFLEENDDNKKNKILKKIEKNKKKELKIKEKLEKNK